MCLALIAFILGLLWDFKRKKTTGLEVHLARAAAAGTVPTSLLLIYCAFDPSVLPHLTGLNVPIAAAGMALLYISLRGVFK
ncbi:MAG TPA: hypothetical protein VH639_04240 [Bryobacteraceae bacterium]